MRRMILGVAVMTMLGGLLFVPQAMAAADDQSSEVCIVEPAFRPPREWNYTPNDLTVVVGAPITSTNTRRRGTHRNSGGWCVIRFGQSTSSAFFSLSPETPGTYKYHRTFHPSMTIASQ
jgi:plastocyanin